MTIRVGIVGASPPIWLRLEMRSGLTLDKVHDLLQVAFGWSDEHLHGFALIDPESGRIKEEFSEPRGNEVDLSILGFKTPKRTPEHKARVLAKPGDSLVYTYDYGDDWEHRLELEDVAATEPGSPLAIHRR